MNKVISSNRLPIKLWLSDLDQQTQQQAANLADLPFAFHHIALMPDAHLGYGMPIGGVLCTQNVIVPNAVGVDIGCGMLAAKTDLRADDVDIPAVLERIRERVPVGRASHDQGNIPDIALNTPLVRAPCMTQEQITPTYRQLGTLGGGNHFIELQKDEEGFLWYMIHSGSRAVGYKIAKHYNEKAKKANATYFSVVDPKVDLAFLPLNSGIGKNYIHDMEWCVRYAHLNRGLMGEAVMEAFDQDFCLLQTLDRPHNYAAMENHFGHNVMVHRKGACRARAGELAMIPGSQGTASYIVRGLGHPDSFSSCSHGAGRRMSRAAAKRDLTYDEENAKVPGELKSLDEAPGAYKDIEEVMNNQKDLVEIVTRLEPLGGVKG